MNVVIVFALLLLCKMVLCFVNINRLRTFERVTRCCSIIVVVLRVLLLVLLGDDKLSRVRVLYNDAKGEVGSDVIGLR